MLLLSLFALFGNLVGALALDALLPIPGSDVTLTTVPAPPESSSGS